MKITQTMQVSLQLDPDFLGLFTPLFQEGITVPVRVEASLKSVLCDQCGIDPEYLANRISTMFLNGKLVDQTDSAVVSNNSELALSAAMPGLVGATFRCGGVLSPFRAAISFKNEHGAGDRLQEGLVIIRLYNLLISELGPGFLERGIYVTPTFLGQLLQKVEAAGSLLSSNQGTSNQGPSKPDGSKIMVDNCPATADMLEKMLNSDLDVSSIFLTANKK